MGLDTPTPYFAIRIQLKDGWLPSDIVDWLEANVGKTTYESRNPLFVEAVGWDAWGRIPPPGTHALITFKFADVRKATLFKLTWA